MAKQNLGRVVGLSAYEIWLQQGNEGSEQAYLDSLKGADGEKGEDGHTPVKGEDYFTEEELNQIVDECKPKIVVGDITEASIMMEDNVNVQLTEPLTQLFLEFPEEIEIGYRSEITFKMSETEMTFYPDLEYDGDIAWNGQYVSDGRPYISLGSTYHIVFTYDINGMKAVINGDETLNTIKDYIDKKGFIGIGTLEFKEPNETCPYYAYPLGADIGKFGEVYNNNESIEIIWDGVSYILEPDNDQYSSNWGNLEDFPCYLSLASERIFTNDTSKYHKVIVKDIRGNVLVGNTIPSTYLDIPQVLTKTSELINDEGFLGVRKLKFNEPNNMSNYHNYWLYGGECGDFSPIFNNNEPLEVIWDGVSYTLQYNGDMSWGYLDVGPCYISLNNERINTTDTSEYHSVIIKDIRGNIILGDLVSSEFIDLNNYATKDYVNGKLPVSWNDVLDKPGMYDKEETTTLLENAEITTTTMSNGYGYLREATNIKDVFANTTMKYNGNYIIVFDGITYYKPSYFNTPMPANYSCLGNEYLYYKAAGAYTTSSYDTGEPFAFDEYGTFYCVEDQPGTHTLSIYELTGNIITVKIPEKYLPVSEAKTIEEQGISFIDLESLNLLGTSSKYTIKANSDIWNKLQELTFGTGLDEVAIITQITHGKFGMSYGTHQGTSPNDMYQFNCDFIFEQQGSSSSLNNYKYYFYVHKGISYGGTVDSDISITRKEIGLLTMGNTKSYTVSSNYNPAHKKYVDDAISTAIGDISTILSTLTTVSEVSE